MLNLMGLNPPSSSSLRSVCFVPMLNLMGLNPQTWVLVEWIIRSQACLLLPSPLPCEVRAIYFFTGVIFFYNFNDVSTMNWLRTRVKSHRSEPLLANKYYSLTLRTRVKSHGSEPKVPVGLFGLQLRTRVKLHGAKPQTWVLVEWIIRSQACLLLPSPLPCEVRAIYIFFAVEKNLQILILLRSVLRPFFFASSS